jgi:hypothetical protein
MELLTINIFAGMGAPDTPTADDIDQLIAEGTLIKSLADLTESPTFYADLREQFEASTDRQNTVLTKIVNELKSTAFDETASPGERLESAMLVVDIALNTSDAGEVVDSVVDLAGQIAENPENFSDTDDVVSAMIDVAFSDYAIVPLAYSGRAMAMELSPNESFVHMLNSLRDTAGMARFVAQIARERWVGWDWSLAEEYIQQNALNYIIAICVDTLLDIMESPYGYIVDELQDLIDLIEPSDNPANPDAISIITDTGNLLVVDDDLFTILEYSGLDVLFGDYFGGTL